MGVLGWVDWACPISCAHLSILILGVWRSTLSYIWCKLNLPVFLFRVGLLTLMYIDSLIVLAMPWSSLPIILKLSCVIIWPVLWLWLCIGRLSLGFLWIFLQRSWRSPLCIPHHMQCHHIGPVDDPLLIEILVSSIYTIYGIEYFLTPLGLN